LNPAQILGSRKRNIYLDHPAINGSSNYISSSLLRNDSYYHQDTLVTNRWDSNSSIQGVNIAPLYQIAAIIPMGERFSMGLTNRSFADSGPYRQIYSIEDSYYFLDNIKSPRPGTYTPDHLSTLNNKQTMFGTQSELTLGYRLSSDFDIGLRLGQFSLHRQGLLGDSTNGTKPHEKIDQDFSENFNNQTEHWVITCGCILHLTPSTHIGIQAGFVTGDNLEDMHTADKDITWQEVPSDNRFYDSHDYLLEKENVLTHNGSRILLRIHMEHQFSEQWSLLSSLSYQWQDIDLSSNAASQLAMTYEWTQHVYDKGIDAYFIQQVDGQSRQFDSFNGTGIHNIQQCFWSTALTYQLSNSWLVFGGIQLNYETTDMEVTEKTSFNSDSSWEYSRHFPGNSAIHENYQSAYDYSLSRYRLGILLPLGLRAKVVNGLHILFGADLFYSLSRLEENGELLYSIKARSESVNDKQLYSDLERNRRESYHVKPVDLFNRSNSFRFGLVCEPLKGLQLMLNTGSDLSLIAQWSLGCHYSW